MALFQGVFFGFLAATYRDMAREYQIDRCNRRVTKKISWGSDVGQHRYGTLNTAKIAIFRVSYLSSPMSELHEIFFGDSPIPTLNSIFPGHVSAPHRFWEKRHGWNHGNPKMPLSLALFSDMVGISAMAIRSHWKIGLVWFPTEFWNFPIKWSWDI